jgi:hypothetical protein
MPPMTGPPLLSPLRATPSAGKFTRTTDGPRGRSDLALWPAGAACPMAVAATHRTAAARAIRICRDGRLGPCRTTQLGHEQRFIDRASPPLRDRISAGSDNSCELQVS